jgi:hypothetical protein
LLGVLSLLYPHQSFHEYSLAKGRRVCKCKASPHPPPNLRRLKCRLYIKAAVVEEARSRLTDRERRGGGKRVQMMKW